MKKDNKLSSIFAQIPDHRSHINRLHNLNDILLIGITAVICGAETWEQIENYAISKEKFLRTFLELPQGIPSDDTINRVLQQLIVQNVTIQPKTQEFKKIPSVMNIGIQQNDKYSSVKF